MIPTGQNFPMIYTPTTTAAPVKKPARAAGRSPVRRSPALPRNHKATAPKISDQFGVNAASKHARRVRFKERLAAFLTACPWHSTSEAVVMLAERGLA
jgi:hypothetical protein